MHHISGMISNTSFSLFEVLIPKNNGCLHKHDAFRSIFAFKKCLQGEEVLYLLLISRKIATKTWFLSSSEPDYKYLFNSQPVFTCKTLYFMPNPDYRVIIMASNWRKCKRKPTCGCFTASKQPQKITDFLIYLFYYYCLFFLKNLHSICEKK